MLCAIWFPDCNTYAILLGDVGNRESVQVWRERCIGNLSSFQFCYELKITVKKKKKAQLLKNTDLHDIVMVLLGIYSNDLKTGSQRDSYTLRFIAALSTIAKKWNLPKCPSTNDYIKKIWYVHTMQHYSVLNKLNKSCSMLEDTIL